MRTHNRIIEVFENLMAASTSRRRARRRHGWRRPENVVISAERLERRELLTSDVVTSWNEILLDAIRTERPAPPAASRAMAIVHTAIFDAVNSIDQSYEPYFAIVPGSAGASVDAAVAAAAQRTLVSLFPDRQSDFDAALVASLSAVPDGPAETLGVQVGFRVADQILNLRSTDGSGGVVEYIPGVNPGEWRPTPSGLLPSLMPQWPKVAPFALSSGAQFRSPAPPALTSAEYAAALAEVQELGSDTSTTRTADQTGIARIWAGNPGTATPPGQWNMIAQDVVKTLVTTTADNARLFALLNVALADAAITAWDTKYAYDLWRPITAIREADSDGNAATVQDAGWTPLITTPPFSSYTSGHSTFSGAASAVLSHFFGNDNVPFGLQSEFVGVADRSYTSFSEAAAEAGISRIYGGIHFSFDNTAALQAGNSVGNYVTSTLMRPVVRINAGGPELVSGGWFRTDSAFQNGVGNSYRTSARINMSGVSAELPEQLFQTVLWDNPGRQELQFRIPARAGAVYRVDLLFSEIWSGAFRPNARKFDVVIDGQLRLKDLDIFAEVGANSALMKSLEIVSDGEITIELLHRIQNPAIAGIQITELTPPPVNNTPPEISAVPDVVIEENTATEPLPFTVTDADGDFLTVTATSSNTDLLPAENLMIAGTGTHRTVTATPVLNQFGTAVVTLQVSDGIAVDTDQFMVTVNEVIGGDAPPRISPIADQFLNGGRTIHVPLTVIDPESQELTVTVAADDTSVVTHVGVTGTGTSRTLSITAGTALGSTVVTVTVSDGTHTVTETFNVTASLLINSGGRMIAGNPGFVPDRFYRNVGSDYRTSAPISPASGADSLPVSSLTIPEEVFQTVAFDWPGGPELEYDIPLLAGEEYRIDLLFSEIWDGAFAVGRRVFDVRIDGQLLLEDLDIFAEVGANRRLIKTFDITSDGNLDIDLFHVVQNPAIAGIQITRLAEDA